MATRTNDPLNPSRAHRQVLAEELIRRFDRPMSVLGVLFLLVVLGQNVATREPVDRLFATAGWVLWAVFAAEYALRLFVAPDRRRFLRRTWWQLLFLVLPFLRFLRLLSAVRLARLGGVVGSAVRGGRSAGQLLTGRLTWLASVSVIVILAASQVLHAFAGYARYWTALHEAALATITGEPLTGDGPLVRVVEVTLGAYSVVVFATLAGAMGAYFLHRGPAAGTDAGDAEDMGGPGAAEDMGGPGDAGGAGARAAGDRR